MHGVFKMMPGSLRVAILLVVTLFVVGGCDLFGNDDSGGGGSSGALGETLTLPGGSVSGWEEIGGSAQVIVKELSAGVAGSASVGTDGRFSGMEIGSVPSGDLSPITDEFTLSGDITIDNEEAQVFVLGSLAVQRDGTDVGKIGRTHVGGSSSASGIGWWYTDSAVRVTGTVTFGLTFTYDLRLQPGWNRVLTTFDTSTFVTTVRTGAEPSGSVWVVPEDE